MHNEDILFSHGTRLVGQPNRPLRPGATTRVKLLVLVEGTNDIEFLRRLGHLLHQDDPRLPDLANMEFLGELVFVPFGGGDVRAWSNRLAPLGLPELHLYDAELAPETASRIHSAAIVNQRPNCRAFVTTKRCLENYLAPAALWDARGIHIQFGDHDDVAELAARCCYEQWVTDVPWETLPGRARKRQRERAKRWLNTEGADHMEAARLAERDPLGEVRSWLRAAADLASIGGMLPGGIPESCQPAGGLFT